MSAWTFEQLESHAATLNGRTLESVRFVAQFHAYHSDEPRDARLSWAALSLDVNRRGHGDGPWDKARMLHQDFMLRTWVIEHLGPGTEPAWNPEILAALTLDPGRPCTAAHSATATASARPRSWPQTGAAVRSSRSATFADTRT